MNMLFSCCQSVAVNQMVFLGAVDYSALKTVHERKEQVPTMQTKDLYAKTENELWVTPLPNSLLKSLHTFLLLYLGVHTHRIVPGKRPPPILTFYGFLRTSV